MQRRILDYSPTAPSNSNKRKIEENADCLTPTAARVPISRLGAQQPGNPKAQVPTSFNVGSKVARVETKIENVDVVQDIPENEIEQDDSFVYNQNSSDIDNLIRLEQLRKAKADADLAEENLKAGKIKNYYSVLAAVNHAKNSGYILKQSDPSYVPTFV